MSRASRTGRGPGRAGSGRRRRLVAGKGVDRALAGRVEALLDDHRDGLLPIVQAGDPVLRSAAEPYRGQLGPALLRRLVTAMRTTMLDAPGVGLAAPQIGLGLALAVVEDESKAVDEEAADAPGRGPRDADLRSVDVRDVDPREELPLPFRVLVNPSYVPVGDERVSFYEGCLSVEGYQAVRTRWRRVRLRWTDERGRQREETLTGWPARIVQHETDHLHGELYIDQAILRSLATYPNLRERWAGEGTPRAAAAQLGFALAQDEPSAAASETAAPGE